MISYYSEDYSVVPLFQQADSCQTVPTHQTTERLARPDDCVMSRNPSPHNVALTVMEHNHCTTSALVSVLYYDLP